MLGRFIGRDTFGGVASAPQSGNRYSYAANNPFRYTDPSGRFAQAMKDDPGMATSMALQVVPIVGDLYSLAIGLTGWDPIAGINLDDLERGASMFAALPFVPPIAGAVKSVGRRAHGAFNAANVLFDLKFLKMPGALGIGGVFDLLSRIGGSMADARKFSKAADASAGARARNGLGGVLSVGSRAPGFSARNASGPWFTSGVRTGGAVSQVAQGSCVAACGEMLTLGARSQADLLDEIGEWSNPGALSQALGEGWTSNYFDNGADAVLAAQRGPMGAVLQVPFSPGHMVVIEPTGAGSFLVRDPSPGVTYNVTEDWIEQYVAGGVYR